MFYRKHNEVKCVLGPSVVT